MFGDAEQHLARRTGDESGRVRECADQGQSAAADGERGGEVGVESGVVGAAAAVADLD
ncbi:hypothetical protein [Micromonospora sp. NPDC005324]|uniref:hypothetical protein n=1 Tax=Micromonospora sp. NPDC005324 TaxID=3157033 RepID=UPI0033AED610